MGSNPTLSTISIHSNNLVMKTPEPVIETPKEMGALNKNGLWARDYRHMLSRWITDAPTDTLWYLLETIQISMQCKECHTTRMDQELTGKQGVIPADEFLESMLKNIVDTETR